MSFALQVDVYEAFALVGLFLGCLTQKLYGGTLAVVLLLNLCSEMTFLRCAESPHPPREFEFELVRSALILFG